MKQGVILCIQTGNNIPKIINQTGNLGFVPTFSINGNGSFSMISENNFPINKTSIFCSGSIVPTHEISVDFESNLPNQIDFTNSIQGNATNGIGQFSFFIVIGDSLNYTSKQLATIHQAKSLLLSRNLIAEANSF